MTTVQEILDLADKRLLESQCLLANNHSEGAYYLAGYVVELTLKAHICKLLDMDDFYASNHIRKVSNAYHTHNFEQLLTLSGWRKRLEDETALSSPTANIDLAANWLTICKWSEQKRYEPTVSTNDAVALINALTDPLNGFLAWTQRNW